MPRGKFRFWGLGFRGEGLGIRVYREQGLGIRALGFAVWGLELHVDIRSFSRVLVLSAQEGAQ